MLNLAGSNYHFGKCSVENGLVRQLLESSFEDTLSPPISWGFRILFYLCFLFLCHNISEPKSSEEHSPRPINVNKGNKKGGGCISVNVETQVQVLFFSLFKL